MPPLNAIVAKLQDFNECIIGAYSFFPMCVHVYMEATQEGGMGKNKCEASVSKQKSCKNHHCCFQKPSG